jgi:hypothetical protein
MRFHCSAWSAAKVAAVDHNVFESTLPYWAVVLSSFQTIIAATIGFTGVICTLWWNAFQGRRLERYRIDNERLVLLSSFSAEFAINIKSLKEDWTSFSAKEKSQVGEGDIEFYPTTYQHKIYDSSLNRLGLLGDDLAYSIVATYSNLAGFESIIAEFNIAGEQTTKLKIPRAEAPLVSSYLENAYHGFSAVSNRINARLRLEHERARSNFNITSYSKREGAAD